MAGGILHSESLKIGSLDKKREYGNLFFKNELKGPVSIFCITNTNTPLGAYRDEVCPILRRARCANCGVTAGLCHAV